MVPASHNEDHRFKGVSAGDDATAGGRAGGVGGVETVHSQSCGSHLVEDGCLQVRVAVVGRLVPAVVVTHEKDDVGWFGGKSRYAGREDAGDRKGAFDK